MNTKKLARYNATHAMSARIHLEDLQDKLSVARLRGDMAALMVQIHAAIAPELQAMRQADAILDNCTKGRPETGRNLCELGSLAKYDVAYRMGTIPGSLARENDSFAGLRVASMDKASDSTRGADNSLAMASN